MHLATVTAVEHMVEQWTVVEHMVEQWTAVEHMVEQWTAVEHMVEQWTVVAASLGITEATVVCTVGAWLDVPEEVVGLEVEPNWDGIAKQ